MNVLLISLQATLDTIGLKQLHYSLRANGHSSWLLYLPRFGRRDDGKLQQIRNFVSAVNPGLIGVSLMSIEYRDACDATGYLKRLFPEVPVIWGGIHPTILPESCLDHADYVCVGEGERSIIKAAACLEAGRGLRGINNLCFRENGRVVRNPLSPLIENLDALPASDHLPVNSYIQSDRRIRPLTRKLLRKNLRWSGTTYSLLTSRGCPLACTYCCNNFLQNLYGRQGIRRKSVANIMAELGRAIGDNPEIDLINVQDSSFLLGNDDYVQEFCRYYRKEVGKPFVVRAIPAFVNRRNVGDLKRAGLAWITLGLQSGSDRVCAEVYRRRSFRDDFLRAAGIIKEHNLAAFYDVILDNPFESDEDRFRTIEALSQTPRPFYTQFFSLDLYFGTELHERACREHPNAITDCREKDYNYPLKSAINQLIRLAAYYRKESVGRLVAMYRENPAGLKFRARLRLTAFFSALVYEPLAYFRILRLSFGGSTLAALAHIRPYLREGIVHYLNQFRRSK